MGYVIEVMYVFFFSLIFNLMIFGVLFVFRLNILECLYVYLFYCFINLLLLIWKMNIYIMIK